MVAPSLLSNSGSIPDKEQVKAGTLSYHHEIQLFWIFGYYLLLKDELLMQKRLILKG